MKMSYHADDDILIIEFNKDKIVRDISLNWNVNVGMTEQGIGEIVILDAKKAGLLPVELDEGLRANPLPTSPLPRGDRLVTPIQVLDFLLVPVGCRLESEL